jgi:hypothetical protein
MNDNSLTEREKYDIISSRAKLLDERAKLDEKLIHIDVINPLTLRRAS